MQDGRLSELGPLSLESISEAALSLARQIAELHRRGVVHGHIRPSRVQVVEGTFQLDPPDGAGLSKPHDVRSIGELTLWLLSRSGLRATGRLAEEARAAAALDPAARPTAEELVSRLERVVGAVGDESAGCTPANRTRRDARVRVGICVLVGVVATGMIAWTQRPMGELETPSKPASQPARTVTASHDRLPAQVWPDVIRACADAGPLVADLDNDGCEEAIAVRGSRLEGVAGAVEIKGISVGHYVTGDWSCLGHSTLAVLEPASGTVFVFPRWASPGDDVPALTAARVAGARALLSGDADGDGCDDLRALTAEDEIPVDVPPARQP